MHEREQHLKQPQQAPRKDVLHPEVINIFELPDGPLKTRLLGSRARVLSGEFTSDEPFYAPPIVVEEQDLAS